ncbi:MAG: hypothetical protein ACFFAH_12730 [Promethearchaeota archaeon]
MKRIEINMLEGTYGRLKEISKAIGIEFDRVVNIALFEGFPHIWGKFVESFDNYIKSNLPKKDKDKKIYETWDMLANYIEDTFEKIQEVEAVQQNFEKIYSINDFSSLKEMSEAFGEFIKATKKKKKEP